MQIYDPQNPPADIIEEIPPVLVPTDTSLASFQDEAVIPDVVEGIPTVRPPTDVVRLQLTEVEADD